jgi:hypothetical protein
MRMGMRNGMVWRLVDDCLVIRYDTPGIQNKPRVNDKLLSSEQELYTCDVYSRRLHMPSEIDCSHCSVTIP